jgi:nucleoside-diphosphate-sugar epimerase
VKTMREIVCVGGAGYIGSRFMEYAVNKGVDWVECIDLGIYGNQREPQDVDDLDVKEFKDKVVVYFAGFHREPDDLEDREAWEQAYQNLMIRIPMKIATSCFHLIYVSSMRALTDRASLYGKTKSKAERVLSRFGNTTSVRFGTIWGDLRQGVTLFPNRPTTAVNFALTRKKFSGNNWTAFTTHINKAVIWLYTQAVRLSSPMESPKSHLYAGGTIVNVTDLERPLIANEIRALLANDHTNVPLQALFRKERVNLTNLTQDILAAQNLYDYYGLKRKPDVESD